MSFQREGTNDIKMPSVRHHLEVMSLFIYKCKGICVEQIIINISYQEVEILRFYGSRRIEK